MKRLVALLLAIPVVALAQQASPPASPPAPPAEGTPAPAPDAPAAPAAEPPAPPPPQAAPPAYPPPPPGAPAQPPPYAPGSYYQPPVKQRDRWYIGFGVGSGSGSAVRNGLRESFEDLNLGRDPTTVFLNFKVGATLTPRLLLGLDIGAIVSAADENDESTAVSIANVNVVATFFPMEKGLFVRGGIGRSGLAYAREVGGVTREDSSANGFNVLGGVGYAFWLGRAFNLTVNLDLSSQWYSSNAGGFDDSRYGALWLGFDWY